MAVTHFILEGIDRLGKDTLATNIQHRLGYHLVLHYSKPLVLDCYNSQGIRAAQQAYQLASFQSLFALLAETTSSVPLICNRAHIGECVYAQLYRGYSGEYVFDLERNFEVSAFEHVRLVLLVEEFSRSKHFVDDGRSLGAPEKRRSEQALFLEAYRKSRFRDKRIVNVTGDDGRFRPPAEILDDALRGARGENV